MNDELYTADTVVHIILLGGSSLVNIVEQLDIRGLTEESLVDYLFVRVKQLEFME